MCLNEQLEVDGYYYTANSIEVLLKKREKVEYECKRLVGND